MIDGFLIFRCVECTVQLWYTRTEFFFFSAPPSFPPLVDLALSCFPLRATASVSVELLSPCTARLFGSARKVFFYVHFLRFARSNG